MKKILFWVGVVLVWNFTSHFCLAQVTWDPDAQLTDNTAVSAVSRDRSIAIDFQNRIHIVWEDWRDGNPEIYYKRSLDGGQTWGGDVPLTSNGAYSDAPSIAVDSRNGVHVVWEDERDGNYEIYYKRSLDGGETWGGDIPLTTNNAKSLAPSIAVDFQNRVYVVWQDERDGNWSIYYKNSLDGGQTWGNDTALVNSFYSTSPSIATDCKNRVHVVWQDWRYGAWNIYYKRSLDGGQTWSNDVPLTATSTYSWYPAIAADSKDGVHVVWEDYRYGSPEIYYKRSLDGGETWGGDSRLTVNYAYSFYPAIATSSQNRVHVVWYDYRDGNAEIYYKRSVDRGQNWGIDTRLTFNGADSLTPSIASDAQDKVHVVWQDNRSGNFEVYYKRGTQQDVWSPSVALPGVWAFNYDTVAAIFGVNPTLPMERVITDLQRMGAKTVFLHTGGGGVTGPEGFFSVFPPANLARFLSLAHQAGLKVHAWCVDSHGSAQFLEKLNNGFFITAVNEVIAWNSSHLPGEHFDGIHTDIEGLSDADAQSLVNLYNQINIQIENDNLEFSAPVDAKSGSMSPTERGSDYAQLAYPLDLIVPMAYIIDAGFDFNDWLAPGKPREDFNYWNDVYQYTQEKVGNNCAIGMGFSAYDRTYGLRDDFWYFTELAHYDYLTNLWDFGDQYTQDLYHLKYNSNLSYIKTTLYPSSGVEAFGFQVTSPSGFTLKYGDPRDNQSVLVPYNGRLVAYQTTQDSLKESMNRFPNNYCFWNYDSIYKSRRMGLFTVEVDVEPDIESVPQGGTLGIRVVTLTNHLNEPATFKLSFDTTEPPDGVKNPILQPEIITLEPNVGESRYVTYPVDIDAALGNWILTATVEGVDSNIYDQDSFDFKVIPEAKFPPYAPQAAELFDEKAGKVKWEPDVPLTDGVSNAMTSREGTRSVATGLGNGIHVVWYDDKDLDNEVYYRRSLDGGITWEEDNAQQLTENDTDSKNPTIATDWQGRIHVVWQDYRNGEWGIYYKHSLDGGKTWPIEDTPLTTNRPDCQYPSIATDGQNAVYVFWNSKGGIYYRRSFDGGKTWEETVRYFRGNNNSYYPSITVDAQDTLHVVWEDNRDGDFDIYYNRSVDRGQTWEEEDQPLSTDEASSEHPSIATDDRNGVHVVWMDDRNGGGYNVYYKHSLDGGQTWPIADDRRSSASSWFPSIATGSKNRVHLIWPEDIGGGAWRIYYQRSLDRGQTWEKETGITEDGTYSSIATDFDNNIHVIRVVNDKEIDYKRGTKDTNWKLFGPVHR